MGRELTEAEVYERLHAAIAELGSQRAFATKVGLTPAYINDVVHRRRLLSDTMLAAIGIERIVTTTYRETEHSGTDSGTTERGEQKRKR